MTEDTPETLADRCENFMNGTKRLFDGERLSGTKGDMWFFKLYHHLDACAAALRKSPDCVQPHALLSEEEIAALILEHVEVGYTLGEGGLVDPDTIFVSTAGAAHVIAHRLSLPDSGWRTDIENAPMDGSTVWFPLETAVAAFWCNDLKRWVLSRPLHLESLIEPKRFRLKHIATQTSGQRTDPNSMDELERQGYFDDAGGHD
jgi:hypothetical protein